MRGWGIALIALGLAALVASFVMPATVKEPGRSELQQATINLDRVSGMNSPLPEPDILVDVPSEERQALRQQLTIAGGFLLLAGIGLAVVGANRGPSSSPEE